MICDLRDNFRPTPRTVSWFRSSMPPRSGAILEIYTLRSKIKIYSIKLALLKVSWWVTLLDCKKLLWATGRVGYYLEKLRNCWSQSSVLGCARAYFHAWCRLWWRYLSTEQALCSHVMWRNNHIGKWIISHIFHTPKEDCLLSTSSCFRIL